MQIDSYQYFSYGAGRNASMDTAVGAGQGTGVGKLPANGVTESDRATANVAVTRGQQMQTLSATYDMTNITPTEIDRLAASLRESGAMDERDILMLETNGASFRAASMLGQQENAPFDMLERLQTRIDDPERVRSDDFMDQSLERQKDFLDEIQGYKAGTGTASLSAGAMQMMLSGQEV